MEPVSFFFKKRLNLGSFGVEHKYRREVYVVSNKRKRGATYRRKLAKFLERRRKKV
jgi:hypothetical protein